MSEPPSLTQTEAYIAKVFKQLHFSWNQTTTMAVLYFPLLLPFLLVKYIFV
jgi:hypothetical protein